MADTVTSTKLIDNARTVIYRFTNKSDGTGESAVLKVDVSGLSPAATEVRIMKIWADTQGMAVELLWDANTDVLAWSIPQDTCIHQDFTSIGGLTNNAGAGKTGDLLLTTIGHSPGDSYTIVLEMAKK